MHENVPVRFGRGRLDSLATKGLAAYLINATVRFGYKATVSIAVEANPPMRAVVASSTRRGRCNAGIPSCWSDRALIFGRNGNPRCVRSGAVPGETCFESSTRPASRRLSRRWTIRLSRSRCREKRSRKAAGWDDDYLLQLLFDSQ